MYMKCALVTDVHFFLTVIPELAANDQLMKFWMSIAKPDVSIEIKSHVLSCACCTDPSSQGPQWLQDGIGTINCIGLISSVIAVNEKDRRTLLLNFHMLRCLSLSFSFSL